MCYLIFLEFPLEVASFDYNRENNNIINIANNSLSSADIERAYLFHAKKLEAFDGLEKKLQYIELKGSSSEIRCLLKLSLIQDKGFNDAILQSQTFNTDLLSIKKAEFNGDNKFRFS